MKERKKRAMIGVLEDFRDDEEEEELKRSGNAVERPERAFMIGWNGKNASTATDRLGELEALF